MAGTTVVSQSSRARVADDVSQTPGRAVTPGKPTVGAFIADTCFYNLAENAIRHTMSLGFIDHFLVLSDNELLGQGLDRVSIDRIGSIEDYNRIVIENLPGLLVNDFYLFVQYDGFPLDATKFDEEFFQYDYIGAVWPQFESNVVGNGGFSWRSKKLMQAAGTLAHLRLPKENEDVFICRSIRHRLEEEHGIRFSPVDLASKFSFEALGQPRDAFGFHGFMNLPMVYQKSPEYLLYNLPDQVLEKRLHELLWGALLIDDPSVKRNFDIALARRITALRQVSTLS